MFRDYLFLALQSLKRRGIRSWLTMLGIFIGIAAVVSLISLGGGLQTAITGQFSVVGPDRLFIENTGTGFGPPGSTSVKKLTEHDLEIVLGVNGVENAISRIVRVAQVDYNRVSTFEYVASIPNDGEDIDSLYEMMNFKIAQGDLIKEGDRGLIIVGDEFTKDNKFDKPLRVGSRIDIAGKSFEVAGILERGNSFIINDVILIPEEDLKDILDIGDEFDQIAVTVDDVDRVEETSEQIIRVIRRDRNQKEGEEDFSVQTPLQALESVNTILSTINLVVAGIAALSLVVGGIGITNTMYTSVLERTREIGIMKAIGARNSDVLLIFLIEAGLLGIVGGIVGIIVGLGLAFGVSVLLGGFLGGEGLEVALSLPLIIASLVFSIIVGVASGALPALQAARLNTVEALRA